MIRKEIRISEKRLQEIDKQMVYFDIENQASYLRELLDIGFLIKQKQSLKRRKQQKIKMLLRKTYFHTFFTCLIFLKKKLSNNKLNNYKDFLFSGFSFPCFERIFLSH